MIRFLSLLTIASLLVSCQQKNNDVIVVEMDVISLCGFFSVEFTVDNAESIRAVARGRGNECLDQNVQGKNRARWKELISVVQVIENLGLHHESIDTTINDVRIVGGAEKYTLTIRK